MPVAWRCLSRRNLRRLSRDGSIIPAPAPGANGRRETGQKRDRRNAVNRIAFSRFVAQNGAKLSVLGAFLASPPAPGAHDSRQSGSGRAPIGSLRAPMVGNLRGAAPAPSWEARRIVIALACVAIATAIAAPDSGWTIPIASSVKATRPSPQTLQRILGEIAVCVGSPIPGTMTGADRRRAERRRDSSHAVAPPDTLRAQPLAACPAVKPDPGYRTYVQWCGRVVKSRLALRRPRRRVLVLD